MKNLILIALSIGILNACTPTLHTAAKNRQNLINQIFPNPADQIGFHLVYPLEVSGYRSLLQIIYFPDQVSQTTVKTRVSRYCSQFKDHPQTSGQAYIESPPEPTIAVLADGTERDAVLTWMTCLKS